MNAPLCTLFWNHLKAAYNFTLNTSKIHFNIILLYLSDSIMWRVYFIKVLIMQFPSFFWQFVLGRILRLIKEEVTGEKTAKQRTFIKYTVTCIAR
jgi:hypothetical protein